jgi:NADH-quinone oxidoreductase subunit J
MLPETLFYVFGGAAVLSAVGMVSAVRHAVAATLCLLVSMLSLAGIYVLLEAYFVAAVLVVVYAGAAALLFLFVVTLLDLRRETFGVPRLRLLRIAGAFVAGAAVVLGLSGVESLGEVPESMEGFGGYDAIGIALYTDYVILVEMAALLLLAAIVGALILTRKKLD